MSSNYRTRRSRNQDLRVLLSWDCATNPWNFDELHYVSSPQFSVLDVVGGAFTLAFVFALACLEFAIAYALGILVV